MKNPNRKSRAFVWLIAALAATIAIAGCGKSVIMDKAALSKVKTVAVIGFTTPQIIKFRDNPREDKEPLLAMAINAAMPANGPKAATLAHQNFVNDLNRKRLGFRVLTQSEMMANSEFRKLAMEVRDRSLEAQAKESSSGGLGKMLSMFGGSPGPKPAASPDGMPQFGLVGGYGTEEIKRSKDEQDYMRLATKALNVDAVMLLTDSGYSFVCDACVGGTGAASTGSAFSSVMMDRDGKVILALRQWFAVSKGSSVVAAYVVNPLQWDSLFREHGKKLATVWADQYKEDKAAK